MEMTEKAMLDSVIGANLAHEDLSNSLTLTDGPKRPISQVVAQVPAKNKLHQWNEQGLNVAGRNNVAGGGATYAEGIAPTPQAKSPGRKSNVTCRIGRLAQVSDTMRAEFDQGGQVTLADGEQERLLMDALDLEAALALIEVLNQGEWMHMTGDSSQTTMEGGETDGLIKWCTSSGGNQVSSDTGSSGSPTNFVEQFILDGMKQSVLAFPSLLADTMFISPELGPDMTKLVQNGASRPLVQVANGQNIDLVAGASVSFYTTPWGTLKIVPHPYLSPTFNTNVTNSALLAVNMSMIKIANLNKLQAELLPRTGPSISKMITWEWAQEHRNVKHTWIAQNLQPSIA